MRIDWAADCADQLRRAALEAFRAAQPVGHEITGILFGRRTRGGFRILGWQEIPRQDAARPAAPLTPREREAARDLLESSSSDLRWREMQPVGWFRTRTRGMGSLAPEDIATVRELFGGTPCLALILRPSTQRPLQASFFWVADGAAGESSRRGAQILLPDERDREPSAAPEPLAPVGSTFPGAANSADAFVAPRRPAPLRWMAPTIAFLIGVATTAAAGYWWVDRPVQLDVRLEEADQGPILSISWNKNVGILTRAEGAELQIDQFPIELSRDQLRRAEYRVRLPRPLKETRIRLRIRGPYSDGQQQTVLLIR